jgi:hypothetical protein
MSPRSASPSHFVSVAYLWALAALAAFGCNRSEPGPPPPAKTPVPAPVPAPPSLPSEAPAPLGPKPGWSQVSMQDTLPICVFASYAERESAPPFPRAKKQTLAANAPVVFGVYPPWCVNEACDYRMLLQCWTERAGTILTVHTRYASDRKDDAKCDEDCMDVDAACETAPLEPGEYTVRHGDKSYALKVPSVVRSPCFGAK